MNALHPSLLPNGLKDLLPPEAEEESRIINSLMASFRTFGYRRVKPPLVEFEENLLAPGPGQALARETFRLMDPVSGYMMGVRADTTAQIARLAASRLKDTERPLRLSYAADVLRVNGTQLRPERQFCQVGCELIGANSVRDDVESALVALKALHDLGVDHVSIDLTIPVLMQALIEAYAIDEATYEAIKSCLQKRDRDGLSALECDGKDDFISLLDASGLADQAIAVLKEAKLSKAAQAPVEQMVEAYDELKNALAAYGLEKTQITIDLIEHRGFEYQEGISFTLFSANSRGELGSGGRYRPKPDGDEQATGFTLYMDTVTQIIAKPDGDKAHFVDENASWQDIKKAQDQHNIVVRKK